MRNTIIKLLASTAILVALGGCSTLTRLENIGKAPALAPIAPKQQALIMPMPTPPTHHNPNSLWQPGARSFFHDPRASRVGDILTVNISVADAAKLSNTTTSSRTNSDDANLTNFFGLESALPKSIDPANVVNMGSDSSHVGAGSINRSESINMTLAAIVSQVLPNGNLVIEGRQQVRVNDELRDLEVTGIVRTEDITNDNTVDLSQIAEARISYGGRGVVSNVQQPRWGSQLFDILMPW